MFELSRGVRTRGRKKANIIKRKKVEEKEKDECPCKNQPHQRNRKEYC